MPPATTITELSLLEKPEEGDCKECMLRNRLPAPAVTISNLKCRKVSVYDETVPKNDPAFLKPVREWEKRMGFETAIRWMNVISISTFHLASFVAIIYAFYVTFFSPVPAHWKTKVFGLLMGQIAGFGVTGGAHRLWCHRSYKAKRPLEILLLMCFSAAGQNTVFDWVRDHRVHHKFSETSADPHDSRRGLFFSHIGWLMMKKHPQVYIEGNKMNMTDITDDPLLRFYNKHFIWFKIAFCFVIPTLIPVYCWGECWTYAILTQLLLRYMFSLHFTFAVNSFAHLYGSKPFDKNLQPSENWMVSFFAMGEGWHNYHHAFPWDYKASELGYTLNTTTLLLDIFAKIGWAYDMKEASDTLVRTVAEKKGDGSKYQ